MLSQGLKIDAGWCLFHLWGRTDLGHAPEIPAGPDVSLPFASPTTVSDLVMPEVGTLSRDGYFVIQENGFI